MQQFVQARYGGLPLWNENVEEMVERRITALILYEMQQRLEDIKYRLKAYYNV